MKKMLRLKAHLASSPTHDEDAAETLTLFALVGVDGKIVGGSYYGEIVEEGNPYPLRYDIRQESSKTGFYFGHYSRKSESHPEEVYRTNLSDKLITVGQVFNVTSSEFTGYIDYTYRIDFVVDIAAGS